MEGIVDNNSGAGKYIELCKNLTLLYNKLKGLTKLNESLIKNSTTTGEAVYDDSANAYLYIIFVLTFYAFSIGK